MRFFAPIRQGLAVTLSSCALATVRAHPQRPEASDLVVINAKVATLDPASPGATAFAVKEGKFVAVGTEGDTATHRGERTRVMDAKGRTIIPGLNDSHLHVVRAGRFYNLELRWDGVDSLERALQMVREQAERTPKGQWVRVVGGWSPYQFRERRMPSVRDLN